MKYSLAVLLTLTGVLCGQERQVLALISRIDLPTVAGRIDHFTADIKGERIFIAALGNHTVEVLNAQSGQHLHSIPDLAEPQGVYFDAATNRLFVACAKDGAAKVFDGGSFELLGTVKFSADADNIRYDARGHRVIVGYGVGTGGLAFLDTTGKKTGEIALEGHPESFQVETKGGHIFVNVPDAGYVVESIDRKTGTVTKWPLKGLRGNYAMALDEENHRLFTITRKTPMMVVLNTETGAEVARLRSAGECDDVFFDASRKRVYVVGGSGVISVFQEVDPDHYELVADVPTGIGIRTGYFYAKRDRLYAGVPAKGNEPAQVWTFEAED